MFIHLHNNHDKKKYKFLYFIIVVINIQNSVDWQYIKCGAS